MITIMLTTKPWLTDFLVDFSKPLKRLDQFTQVRLLSFWTSDIWERLRQKDLHSSRICPQKENERKKKETKDLCMAADIEAKLFSDTNRIHKDCVPMLRKWRLRWSKSTGNSVKIDVKSHTMNWHEGRNRNGQTGEENTPATSRLSLCAFRHEKNFLSWATRSKLTEKMAGEQILREDKPHLRISLLVSLLGLSKLHARFWEWLF